MRYAMLVLLNIPVVLLALANILTQYKIRKISKARFWHQIILWLVILIVLVSSFPIYNILAGKTLFDSSELSSFDIVQTTALIFLFYIINHQRLRIEETERTLRDLHQELSIKLSKE